MRDGRKGGLSTTKNLSNSISDNEDFHYRFHFIEFLLVTDLCDDFHFFPHHLFLCYTL